MRGFKAGTTDPGYEAYMRIGLIGKKLVLSSKVTILTFLLALIAYLLGLLCRDSKGFLSVYLANISPLVPGDNLTTLTMLLASLLVIFIATATLLFKGRGELPLVGGLILLLAGTINYLLPFKDLIPVVLWTATITLALWRPTEKANLCCRFGLPGNSRFGRRRSCQSLGKALSCRYRGLLGTLYHSSGPCGH